MSTNLPYLEYLYSAAPGGGHERTLVVSLPGRKGNRLATLAPQERAPFLSKVLNRSNADVLFLRSVYKDDPSEAYITCDYDLLPDFISKLKTTRAIRRLVLFGFSLGCGPCLWLAKKQLADEVVLIAPGTLALNTLMAIDDLRWQLDFEKFCMGHCPEIAPLPRTIRTKIIHGLSLEADRPKEEKLVAYLKTLIPQALVEGVPDVGHYIPQFWHEHGILQEKIFAALEVQAASQNRDFHAADWKRLENDNILLASNGSPSYSLEAIRANNGAI